MFHSVMKIGQNGRVLRDMIARIRRESQCAKGVKTSKTLKRQNGRNLNADFSWSREFGYLSIQSQDRAMDWAEDWLESA